LPFAKLDIMFKKALSGCLILVAVSAFFCEEAMSQDPQFTQFYANPLYLNPALAGAARCPRVVLNYRNQWPAISGNFITYAASYDQHFDKLSGGLGLQAYNDRSGEGTINSTNISGMYSYNLNLDRKFAIKAGFQGTYFQKSIDWSKLTFGDMIDPRYGFINETQETPASNTVRNVDFSAGLLGYSKIFYFGLAVHHLTQPNESFFSNNQSRLPRKYTLHGGAVIPLDKRYPDEASISPNILYQQQGDFKQTNIGMYVTRGPIVGGVWYRFEDSFILLVGIQTDQFRFGYSYDLTTSKLSNATGGSHEISVTMQFACPKKRRKFRTITCPKF